MFQRKIKVANTNGSSNGSSNGHNNASRAKRRKLKRRLYTLEILTSIFILSLILLYRLLWTSTSANFDPPEFRIESTEAPTCRAIASPEDISTTLVTQLSDDRLWMMQHHCERYGPHAMSIAVYTNETRAQIVDELVKMGCRIDGSVDAATDVEAEKRSLVSVEVLDAHTHGAWNDYPINELRNLALRGVKTTHMTYVDIDFWPSTGFYDNVMAPEIRQKMFEDPKLALVIPAFQLNRNHNCTDETRECREDHVPMMPRSPYDVKIAFQDKSVRRFESTNEDAQTSTDFHNWFSNQRYPHEEHEKLYSIPCLRSRHYEPFLTIRYCRELTPPFQPDFSGYGKNKMIWTMQVVASGFVFSQVGGAFVVHYPHAISDSRHDWNRVPSELVQIDSRGRRSVRSPEKSDGDNLGFDRYHRGEVDRLFVEFRKWLKTSIPEDRARLTVCPDAGDDDNTLWIDASQKSWVRSRKKATLRDRIRGRIEKK